MRRNLPFPDVSDPPFKLAKGEAVASASGCRQPSPQLFLPPARKHRGILKQERMAAAEARKLLASQKRQRSKYGVDITPSGKLERTRIVNGKPTVFHSNPEAKRYDELLLLQEAGYIRRLELQPVYTIEIDGKHVCKVILDFRYWEGSERVVEDVKGFDTQLSKLKRKLVEAAYPGTKVRMVK